MADDQQPTATAVSEAPAQTEAQLTAEMETALKSKDFRIVAQVAAKLAKFQKDHETAAREAKENALASLTLKVHAAIEKTVKEMVDSGELDQADGIWYSNDFGENLTACRLIKAAPKAPRSGGGGAGKKFGVSTNSLLDKYGNQEYKDGQTFRQAHEANDDKNARFAIRLKLLKLEGLIN